MLREFQRRLRDNSKEQSPELREYFAKTRIAYETKMRRQQLLRDLVIEAALRRAMHRRGLPWDLRPRWLGRLLAWMICLRVESSPYTSSVTVYLGNQLCETLPNIAFEIPSLD